MEYQGAIAEIKGKNTRVIVTWDDNSKGDRHYINVKKLRREDGQTDIVGGARVSWRKTGT